MAGNVFKNKGNNTTWVSVSEDVQNVKPFCDVKQEDSFATNETNPVETFDVRERVRKIFDSQIFTDIIFYPKDNRSESISAHRALLAVSSPIFSKMFYDCKNNVGTYEKLQIPISNVSFDAFTRIIKYLYTDEILFDNDALVQDIFDGANHFSIQSLVDKCNEYFENVELTNENVSSKLEMCISKNITALKDRCIEFIERNTLPVIQSCDFQKCNSITVQTICKLQFFNLQSEKQLLDAVMQWLNVRPCHERKGLLEPILKCIRFLNLTVGEFSEILKNYKDLMIATEGLSIGLFLSNPQNNPDFKSLPAWCNRNMENRCFIEKDQDLDDDNFTNGKVIFPLKSDPKQGFVTNLTSELQMKCVSGFHQITAIKLRFERPLSDQCRINSLFINVHVNPSRFCVSQQMQIANSESVRVEFSKKIKMRRGDTLEITAEAKNIKLYKFFQFDETGCALSNPHFKITIYSSHKQDKLYFISEIEYEPQQIHFYGKEKRKNFRIKTK